MKIKFSAVLAAALLCLPAAGQTTTVAATPVWYPIATLSGGMNPLVTTSGPVTYRYGTDSGTTNGGVNCAVAPGCWLPSVTAPLTNFPTLWSTFPKDPASGVSKQFEIQETCGTQTGTLAGVAFTVPALPASSCVPPAPPIPTPVGPLQPAMCQLYTDGSLVCTITKGATVVSQ